MSIRVVPTFANVRNKSKMVGGDLAQVAVLGAGVAGQRVQRSTDGSVWTYESGVWRLESVDLPEQARIEAMSGLVSNGSGGAPAVIDAAGVLRAENYYLSTAYPTDTIVGRYSNLVTGAYNYLDTFSRRAILLQAGVIYGVQASVKAKTLVAGNTFFPIVVGFDADGNSDNRDAALASEIYTNRWNLVDPDAFTVLSRPILVGNTKIYLQRTRASINVFTKMHNGSLSSQRQLNIFSWTNSNGFTYPTPFNVAPGQKPYSRRAYPIWAQGGLVELPATDEIEITLDPLIFSSGWPSVASIPLIGGPWAAGTPVGNVVASDGGGRYPYGTGITYNADGTWKILRPNTATGAGLIKTFETAGNANAASLPPWTQFVRVGMSCNYGPAGNETLFQIGMIEVGGQ